MRIFFIANARSIHAWRWMAPLLARGDQIELATYARPAQVPLPSVKLIDLTRIPAPPVLRWLIWGFWLRRYLRSARPDILHAHQLQAAGWLGVLAGCQPWVVTSWGSDLLIEPHRSALRRALVRQVLARCDILTVPSHTLFTAARELQTPPEKIRLIPWGIDTQVFTPEPADGEQTRLAYGLDPHLPLIFSPRAMTPLYNLDTLLQACQALSHSYPGLQLALLDYNAQPAYRQKLLELSAQPGHRLSVHWLPAQAEPAAMARLYRAADITASLPSSEGYGASVFEALACGCPTVITDLPAYREDLLHGEHTLKIPVRDVERTLETIQQILSQADLRRSLIQNGLRWAAGKSVQIRIQQTEALYGELAR